MVLRDNDIFYIDIGPVWEEWEGDGGNTFVVGNDPEMQRASIAVRQVFDRVHQKWRTDAVTGAALYGYARQVASSMGWELAPRVDGIASVTFLTRRFTQERLRIRPSHPPRICGCSKSRFGIAHFHSGRFTKIYCSKRNAIPVRIEPTHHHELA